MTHENMDEFYKNILDGKNESDSTGIIKLIETGNEDFYLLCRRFVEFAINAKRFKVDDEPTIQALYEFTEVDKLARDVQEFLAKHNVCTGLELLKTIKKRYKEAITNKEMSRSSGARGKPC
jgi:hypothetical protein